VKLRTLAVLVGALSIASAPFVLAVTGGGIPSFLQLLGLGLNTAPQTTVPITVQNLSPNVTAIQAKNDTVHDVEFLATTSSAGNAQYRATNFGGNNWSWGNLRSTGAYVICNSATLTGTCYTFNSTGQLVLSAPSAGSTLTVNGIASGASPAIFVNGTAGSSVVEINSGLALAFNSAGTNFGFIQNDAADHWCLASGASLSALGTNIFCWDKNGNITAPSAGTVPWQAKGTIGKCTAKFTMAGAGTPSLSASSTNCAGSSMSRGSVGSYTWTEANITFPSNIICTIDSSSSGPFVFVTSASNGSAGVTILAVPGSSASVLADPASGAHVTCSAGF
jgi:hypothetical protein